MNNHPFHLVSISPWPILISLSIMNNFFFILEWLSTKNCCWFYYTMLGTLLCVFQWWRDVTREATLMGFHSISVNKLMRMGMILFILSEVFFFFSFFWAYFHSSLSPNIEIGQLWPPMNIIPFNPLDIPLLNTIILISSGLSITWSHHSLLLNNFSESEKSLLVTMYGGFYFTTLQAIEYTNSPFCISDSIYGSIFFITTGFHGLHVIIGTLFLLYMHVRLMNLHFSSYHHFGFEAAAWYWHFVDVIWLFLYISIYWWSY